MKNLLVLLFDVTVSVGWIWILVHFIVKYW